MFGQVFLCPREQSWEIRDLKWGHQTGHRGLLSRPGCRCSHGHWVEGIDGGVARILLAKEMHVRP